MLFYRTKPDPAPKLGDAEKQNHRYDFKEKKDKIISFETINAISLPHKETFS